MGTPTELVSRKEAARLLGISTRTLSSMVSQGMLKAVRRENKSYFARTDVTALMQVFNGRTDFSSILNLALRAFVKAEEAERKVREMGELLGMTSYFIDTSENAILHFYGEVRDRIGAQPPINAVEVMALARKLMAVTEEYLRLVEHVTCDEEPWQPYLQLVQYLMENAPRKYFPTDPELAAAYGYVEAARRQLRTVAYFYVKMQHGRGEANRAFLGVHIADDLLATMFPR